MQKKNILALIPILIAILYQETGIHLSTELAMTGVAILATIIGYFLKNSNIIEEAEEILLPSAEDVLGDIERFIELKYGVDIPDEWKQQIIDLIVGKLDG